jgi:hypothetical protein
MTTYILNLVSDDGNTRTFTFGVEKKSRNGWAKMRLLTMVDTVPPRTTHYDPEIHDGRRHHMSYLWTARSGRTEDDEPTYILYGAFGNSESRIELTPTD